MDSVRPAPEEPRLEAGTVITNYVIEDLLGRGSEGYVYRARDSLLGRQVALKTARAGDAGETRGVEEARVLASLEHPNIVRVYHAKRHQGIWFVAFEYLAGGSLQSLLQRVGALATRQALELAAQAASGLAHVHASHIVHRDIKPHNMLLSKTGELKLADFGLALDLRGDHRAVGDLIVGTPAFLAPELWSGGAGTPASDVFSLGACLFFFLSARLPFVASDAEQLKRAHLELEPKLPTALPAPVRDLVLSMMAKDPDQRPSSASLPAALRLLAQNPHRREKVESIPPAYVAADPFVDGGAERALQRLLCEGRDRAYLSELGSALRARPRGIELRSPNPADAQLLLAVARRHADQHYELVARLMLPKPHTCLQQVIDRKLGQLPAASLHEACDRLLDPARDLAGPAVLELCVQRGMGQVQRADIGVLADIANARGVLCVIVGPSCDDSPLEEFRRIEAFEDGELGRDIEERLQLFVELSTRRHYNLSRDGLRFAASVCLTQKRWWARLAQDSILIAAAAGLRVVSSWAVLGACAATATWHSVDDVPGAWRRRPLAWPSPEVAAQLAQLREAEARLASPVLESSPTTRMLPAGDPMPTGVTPNST